MKRARIWNHWRCTKNVFRIREVALLVGLCFPSLGWIWRGGGVSQSHVLVWHSLLFTLAILRFHLFDIVTCSHSFHMLLVLLFYKCSLVPICNFVSYSHLNWKPAQHWCSDCCPVTVPSKSHRYDFLQVEFKKKTPFLATLRDFCLSGLRRVFAGLCKFQVVVDASPRCHSGPSTEFYSVILAVKWCKSSKTKAYKASTNDRPSTRNLLFSFR